ncbi:MAG: nucleotide sugar dehydrogenase [Saprospiraceae bacterium]|nr:nucleotide sugar dehydrogenase [Saprospiraceae bacterium]
MALDLYKKLKHKEASIAVVGLGYVGLPLALEMGRKFSVIGYDISEPRIKLMQEQVDPSQELTSEAFEGSDVTFTSDPAELKRAHFFIIAVPTPVDDHRNPNLGPVQSASHDVGKALKKGDYVVYESTVYPGCTEEDCLPILEEESNLKKGKDFKIGYSPERINPGDKERHLTNILKIVSGCDNSALKTISKVYGKIIKAGIYEAESIKVAEAAKVIENTQRDLNISFVNELAIIFDRMGIDTRAVLEAAATKWNFLKYQPGLVGGHCIGVDPYYLVHKAKKLGYDPQVILSGRRVNDGIPAFIAKKLVQMLLGNGKNPQQCKVAVLGVTFKANVADIRNSKVADLIRELMSFAIHVHIHDPLASPNEVAKEYKFSLTDKLDDDYDAVIVAVNHEAYQDFDKNYFKSIMSDNPILFDIKGMYKFKKNGLSYWSL